MQFQYSRWTPESMTDEQRLEALVSLFSYLVLQTSGNVEEVLEWLKQIAREYGIFDENLSFDDLVQKLKDMGVIEVVDGTPQLSTRGIQQVRKDALMQIFSSLKKSPLGAHDTPNTGTGTERTGETRSWNFGDSAGNLDLGATMKNAFKRDGVEDFSLQEDDLEVYETEHLTNCATVLMVDVSHSMILYGEDRITPAKQVALALWELIKSKFPKDFLSLVVFGDDARELSINELPFLTIGPHHTNTKAGLQLARNLLRKQKNVNKQIFMITDGKPSAIFEDNGRLYKNSFGLDQRIVNKTLDEAALCRREKITISTFMIARDNYLVDFIEEFTRTNNGRAYYSGLGKLGEMLFVDYIRNRRKKY